MKRPGARATGLIGLFTAVTLSLIVVLVRTDALGAFPPRTVSGSSAPSPHTPGRVPAAPGGTAAPDVSANRSTFESVVISGTRTVYVAASGSDTDSGASPSAAYATIQQAGDVARPGDRILVGPGTYGYLSVYGYRRDAAHWLSIEPVDATTTPTISVADNSGDDGVDIQRSSYVGILGFQIEGLQTSRNTNPSGVGVFRGSDHVHVWGNDIHDFPGGGVNAFYVPVTTYDGSTLPAGGWDLVDVSYDVIHGTSKYSPVNTPGISFDGAVAPTGVGHP